MLENYVKQTVAQDVRSGPLERHLDAFAARMAEAGYLPATIRKQLGLLGHLGEWLRRTRRTVTDLDPDTIEAFVTAYRRRRRLIRNDRATLRHFSEHLQDQGVVMVRPSAPPGKRRFGKLERRYKRYLQQERGLNGATIERYWWFAHRFLMHSFDEKPIALWKLQASDVLSFVVKENGPTGPKRAQLMVTALRSFFRFLVAEGETRVDLALCVPTVPCWGQSTVPKYLSDREVELVLASCDRTKAVGRRDYAILLLLARLGLRAGEVAGLQLEDVKWSSGEIHVLGKGPVLDRVLLLPEVGAALAAYLRRDRPPSPSRRIFLCTDAPRRAFASGMAVSAIVGRALARAGLKPPRKGAHVFRHSLATSLLQKGASMAEIAAVLRHRSADTTELYAKVDIRGLHSLAQPWPVTRGVR